MPSSQNMRCVVLISTTDCILALHPIGEIWDNVPTACCLVKASLLRGSALFVTFLCAQDTQEYGVDQKETRGIFLLSNNYFR